MSANTSGSPILRASTKYARYNLSWIASPPGYELSGPAASAVASTNDPHDAVAGADAVFTDTWTSMGQEGQTALRHQAFAGFTVDAALMGEAADHAVFLHCLPAHRGEEVAAEVIDGPQSVVWQQAANRMHSARSLLVDLAGAGR